MKAIRRQSLSPQIPLYQSKRAAKSSQRWAVHAFCQLSPGLPCNPWGALEQQWRAEPEPPLFSFWVSAWAQDRNFSGVCSQVGSSELVCSFWAVLYPPPSKSWWPCLPLARGSWKLWLDCLFVLQPHTRLYFNQSCNGSAEPVTRGDRKVAQSGKAETGRAVGAPPQEACGSQGPPSRPGKRPGLQHPRGRAPAQREPQRGQTRAALLHACPEPARCPYCTRR